MFKYLVKRLLSVIPLILIISILAFALVHAMPGDPLDMMINPAITGAELELQREKLGLNGTLTDQYIAWLGQVFQGNLGYSISSGRQVTELLAERIPATLMLMGLSLLIGLAIAIPVGVYSARKPYSKLDYLFTGFTLCGISIPNFFLGLALIYIVSVKLNLLPTGMMTTPGQPFSVGDLLLHLILPCTMLGVQNSAQYTRYMRSNMMEVLRQDYVRTARAKGTREHAVVYRHALRNAIMPIITLLGMSLPQMFGGAVITEQIFSWPGIGRLMVQSVTGRDYPVLMALIMITAVLVVLGNLLSDLLYAVVDPRVKLG